MKEKILAAFLAIVGALLIASCDVIGAEDQDEQSAEQAISSRTLENGGVLVDTDGKRINAHGGGMLKVGDYYYWYGEHRYDNGNFLGVSCYRSKDFVNWKNMGDVLKDTSAPDLNSCTIERPKVVYNKSTDKYVMWMHMEGPNWNYGWARAAVAYADEPTGPFTYLKSLRPFDDRPDLDIRDNGAPEWGAPTKGQPGYENMPAGYMSRDCTLFVDTDGTGYFVSAKAENTRLNIYRLTADYLSIDTSFTPVVPFTGGTNSVDWQRESPCLFKRGDYYYLITSKATGWFPNQNFYSYATSIQGPWSTNVDFCPNDTSYTTYRSQSSYVLEITGTEGSTFLYYGDRWAPAWSGPLVDSGYVFAPLNFDASGTKLWMNYGDALVMEPEKGKVSYPQYYNLSAVQSYYPNSYTFDRNSSATLNLDLSGSNTTVSTSRSGVPAVVATPSTTKLTQQWRFEQDGDYVRVINRWSGKVLDVGLGTQNGDIVSVSDRMASWTSQQWLMTDTPTGGKLLKNRYAGRLLDGNRRDKIAQICAEGFYPEIPYTWDDTGKAKVVRDAKEGQTWVLTAVSE